ncbi:MAG: hypothetical protein WBX29_07130, partial [Nitrososphaeraceae archaeon]
MLLHESHLGPFPLETVRSIDDVKPAFLVGITNIARSVTVTIPIMVSFASTIGSLRILFFNMISTAVSTVVEDPAVMSGCEAKFSSNVLREYLLTRSLSVTIPNALQSLVTITLPTLFSHQIC